MIDDSWKRITTGWITAVAATLYNAIYDCAGVMDGWTRDDEPDPSYAAEFRVMAESVLNALKENADLDGAELVQQARKYAYEKQRHRLWYSIAVDDGLESFDQLCAENIDAVHSLLRNPVMLPESHFIDTWDDEE